MSPSLEVRGEPNGQAVNGNGTTNGDSESSGGKYTQFTLAHSLKYHPTYYEGTNTIGDDYH